MKKLLFLFSFLLIFSNVSFADAACDISNVTFDNINTVESIEGQSSTISVNLIGCEEGIQIIPKETRRLTNGDFQNESEDEIIEILDNPNNVYLPGSESSIKVKYWLYEDGCFSEQLGFDCKYYVIVKYLGNTVWNGREKIETITVQQESNKNFQDGVLFASCGDDFFDVCDGFNNSWEYKWSNVKPKTFKECKLSDGDISFINPSFDKIGGQTITLKLETSGKCTSIPIQVHLMSHEGGSDANSDYIIDIDPEHDNEDYITLIPEENKDVVLGFVGHDEECNGEKKPDCKIYVDIRSKNGKLIHSTRDLLIPVSANPPSGSALIQFNASVNFIKGVFMADCYGVCGGIDWEWKTMTGGYGDDASTLNNNTPQQIQITTPKFDRKSPCWREDVDPNKNGKQEGYDKNCYELLAPIPGIGEEFKVDGVGTGRWSIQKLNEFKLGDYINTFFQLALGILMVLSVIMIVVAGVQYMTVESIYGKSDAKERIVSAITGLILGLGIFVILNTINPKLLNINFGEGIKEQFLETKIDPAQVSFIDGTNTSGVVTPPLPEVLNYEPLIGYLYHQQGPGGAPTTLWAAKNGYATVPTTGSPFISGTNRVQANINAQFGSEMTPSEFVQKFYRVLKAKETQINTITPTANGTAVEEAATEVGVDVGVLKTICMIESFDCSRADVVNSYGYTGLFQFHPERTWPEWRKNTSSEITDPYENAYAGAKFLKSNLQKYQSDKNQM
jgi:hypothetical protein